MIESRTPAFWRATLALCMGSVMVFSNLYITQPLLPLLRDAFEVTPLQAGMTLSVTTLTLGFCLLVFGPLSDAIGRRVIILSTLSLLMLTTFAAFFVEDYNLLLVLRGLQGVFIAGLPAAAMAYMGEEFDPKALLLAVGLYIGANSIGGIAGRVISGLAAHQWGWQSSFLTLAVFDLICLVLVIWLLPASRRFEPSPLRPHLMLKDLIGHLRNPIIVTACLVGGFNFFIFVNQYSYITYVLADAPYGLSTDWLGLLFLTYLTGTLAAGFSGRLMSGRSQPMGMALGVLILMAGSLLTLIPHLYGIVLGLFVNALGFFFAHTQAAGWVTRHAERARASATSLYLAFYYAGATLGGFYLDAFWHWGEWKGVVVGSLLVLILTLTMSLWLAGRERSLCVSGSVRQGRTLHAKPT
ncbi:MAG: MFS transporter [Candidatus Thiodiazotropha sp. (ex Monitilora ramsayi)]|nr:MFS transporter [Candidatus Thiodiazotropha sp. (ex Monitilora ramsayi)]